jgi:hypothetical protein
MNKDKFGKHLNDTVDNLKQYVKLKTELYSLIILDRTAKIFTNVIVLMVMTLLLFFFLLFLSFGFVHWFERVNGDALFGYIMVACFYLIIGIIVFLLRRQLFLNPLIKGFTAIFDEEEDLLDIKPSRHDDEEDEN